MSNSTKIAVNTRKACILMFDAGLSEAQVLKAITIDLKRPAEGLIYVDDIYKLIRRLKC